MPWAILPNGPACTKHGVFSVVCKIFGFIASRRSTVIAPATTTTVQLEFVTTASVTFLDGEQTSPLISASASLPGVDGSVVNGAITAFSTAPWPTATVTNPGSFAGGADIESDIAFRTRIKNFVQTLSRGTVKSLEDAVIGVTSGSSKVMFSNLVEDVLNNYSTLFISDGSLVSPVPTAKTTPELVIFNAKTNQKRGRLANWPVDGDVSLFASYYTGTIDSVTTLTPTSSQISDLSSAFVVNNLTNNVVVDSARNIFPVLSNTSGTVVVTTSGGVVPVPGYYTVVPVNFRLWNNATLYPTGTHIIAGGLYYLALSDNTNVTPATNPATWDLIGPYQLVNGVLYNFNGTTGDIELTYGASAGDVILAYPVGAAPTYSYFTGIIQEVQKVVNGVPGNFAVYPGVKATGVKVVIEWPDIQTITAVLSISADSSVTESDLYPLVQAAITTYVNGLSIGQNVIRSELMAAALSVAGVTDVNVQQPAFNIVISDNQLARTSTTNITVS